MGNPSIASAVEMGLSAHEREDLVAFLEALTGTCDPLVADAFAASVGDAGPEDPLWWE